MHSCCLFSFLHPPQDFAGGKKLDGERVSNASEIACIERCNCFRLPIHRSLQHHVVISVSIGDGSGPQIGIQHAET